MSIASHGSQDKDKAAFQTVQVRRFGQASPLTDYETTYQTLSIENKEYRRGIPAQRSEKDNEGTAERRFDSDKKMNSNDSRIVLIS